MHLTQLLNGLKYQLVGQGDLIVNNITMSTSLVTAGSMFFCIKGNNIDGNSLAHKAVGDGATVLVVEKQLNINITQVIVTDVRRAMALIAKAYYGNSADSMHVVSVVGTNGKTSTTYLLDSIFSLAGYSTAVIGSNGIFINGKRYNNILTTPDPIDLHYWLHQMAISKVEYVFIEVSAHAIHYKKMQGIVADYAIFTNCTQDHLDFFATMDNYASTKISYFCQQYAKVAVTNVDDKVGRIIANGSLKAITYGCNEGDYQATDINENANGAEFCLKNGETSHEINMQLCGRFNVYNSLGAVAVARSCGISYEVIVKALATVSSIEGRCQTIVRNDGVRIVVDYAHTPDGVDNILQYLKGITEGKLIVVFGCGGNRDKFKRPLMGQRVSHYADIAIITNDNPRYENPMSIVGDIKGGVSCQHSVVLNRSQALSYALSLASSGDTIAVLGKGAERYQEIKGKKLPFSDVDTVHRLIKI